MTSDVVDAAHIMIGTPAYNGHLHTDYLHSVLGFSRHGIHFSIATISNESLITRARNSLISTFYENPVFTHLLYLDADVFLDHEGLARMLEHDKDVIGAPVMLKGKDENGEGTWNTDARLDEVPVLQSVERVGTAVFMLSRKAVNALVDKAIEEQRTYTINKMLQHPDMAVTHHDIFRVGIDNNEYLSEDFWVCKELRQLGFEIFVDTSVYTRHHGIVAFD